MKIGLYIPSYCYPQMTYERARHQVGEFARKANDLGFDIWAVDHLLHALPGRRGDSRRVIDHPRDGHGRDAGELRYILNCHG